MARVAVNLRGVEPVGRPARSRAASRRALRTSPTASTCGCGDPASRRCPNGCPARRLGGRPGPGPSARDGHRPPAPATSRCRCGPATAACCATRAGTWSSRPSSCSTPRRPRCSGAGPRRRAAATCSTSTARASCAAAGSCVRRAGPHGGPAQRRAARRRLARRPRPRPSAAPSGCRSRRRPRRRQPLDPGPSEESVRHALGLPDRRWCGGCSTAAGGARRPGGRHRTRPACRPSVPRRRRAATDLASRRSPLPTPPASPQLGLGPRELAAAVRAGALVRVADGVVLLPGALERAADALGHLEPFTVGAARPPLAPPGASPSRCSSFSTGRASPAGRPTTVARSGPADRVEVQTG